MNQESVRRIHAKVFGRVQGVFYRASTKETAQELGLSGWVRNMPDGTVELEAEGPEDKIEALIKWLWHGPPYADVTEVEVVELRPENDRSGFHVIYR